MSNNLDTLYIGDLNTEWNKQSYPAPFLKHHPNIRHAEVTWDMFPCLEGMPYTGIQLNNLYRITYQTVAKDFEEYVKYLENKDMDEDLKRKRKKRQCMKFV